MARAAVLLYCSVQLSFTSTTVRTRPLIGPYSTANTPKSTVLLTVGNAVSRCRERNIHFDSGRNVLYQETPNNVVALLDYQAGHWLIDADDGKRPNATSLQAMAAFKPSHDPKPHLKATATEAHYIWAHPGPDTIRHLESAVRGF
jgi:hypothetical protein